MNFGALIKIEGILLNEHRHLHESDECYYLMVYEPRVLNDETSIIHNFKKPVDRRDKYEWKYKVRDIAILSSIYSGLIPTVVSVEHTTIIPIPPSKSKTHPLYDDRMMWLLRDACVNLQGADIRELLLQQGDRSAFHDGERLDPDEMKNQWIIDENSTSQVRDNILICDDVLASGCHFRTAKNILQTRFPQANIIGLFIARSPFTPF